LEDANLKRAAVATDVLGLSGREMLAALLGGEADPAVLADLARGKLRAKLPALRQALAGRVQAHHRVVLSQLLAHIEFLEDAIAELTATITQQQAAATDQAQAVALLRTIPGVGETAAAAIVAEIGTDMTRFPTAKHLASWAGVCPGNKESAGKRLSGRITKGNTWLRAMLGECAWSASRKRGTYLAAQYHRLARRRGPPKAVVAVAHRILVIAYHVLRDREPYGDLGAAYFERLDQRAARQRQRYHVPRLQQLGYTVTLSPAPTLATAAPPAPPTPPH
jgi:transposase